jgi:DNA repair protein RecO
MIFRGKNLYTVSEGKIIQSFQELLNDLTTLTYASYACELIDICVQEEESHRELFKIFVTVLYLMKTGAVDNELLIRAFELKLLKYTGYGLSLENCVVCKKKINTSNYLNLQYYGGVCEDCSKENGVFISKVCYNAIKFLNNVTLDKVYRVNLSKEIKNELEKIITIIISNNYSRKPKSLQMFDFIKESESDE